MIADPSFAVLLEKFFTQRLMQQRFASPNTIKSYRDTFRLLIHFMQKKLCKEPSKIDLTEIDAELICAFLDEIERTRKVSARSRNARLAGIRSFFRYAALEAPAQSAQIQRVLLIPSKKHTRSLIDFLTREQVQAIIAAPNTKTWSGRRDHALLLLTAQTGMRLSEVTGLRRQDLVLDRGAHVRVVGKGRKERCVPLTKQTASVLRTWLRESDDSEIVFPSARGQKLSPDGVQYILAKHVATACKVCTSLKAKRVTPHVLRHTAAMELLQAGIDRAVIALWLGHESVETTQMYFHANVAFMEQILCKVTTPRGRVARYQPPDHLLSFLRNL